MEFLQENRAEVKMFSILEYDKEWEEEKLRKAEYEAGKSQGETQGRLGMLVKFLSNGGTVEQAKEMLGASEEEICAARKELPSEEH